MVDHVDAPKFADINEYIKYIRTNYKPTKVIIPGRFYCITPYKFSLQYPEQELKFYDFCPLIFSWELHTEAEAMKMCVGLNFHQIPVAARLVWLERCRKINAQIDRLLPYMDFGGERMYRIPGLSYPLVYKILMKSKLAIRRYRLDRMGEIRMVPLQDIYYLMNYYSRTYFGVTIKDIDQRYMRYNPINHQKLIKPTINPIKG